MQGGRWDSTHLHICTHIFSIDVPAPSLQSPIQSQHPPSISNGAEYVWRKPQRSLQIEQPEDSTFHTVAVCGRDNNAKNVVERFVKEVAVMIRVAMTYTTRVIA